MKKQINLQLFSILVWTSIIFIIGINSLFSIGIELSRGENITLLLLAGIGLQIAGQGI